MALPAAFLLMAWRYTFRMMLPVLHPPAARMSASLTPWAWQYDAKKWRQSWSRYGGNLYRMRNRLNASEYMFGVMSVIPCALI